MSLKSLFFLKSMFFFSVLLFFKDGYARKQPPVKKSHSLNYNFERTNRTLSNGTLHIVAAIVEFRPDDNRFTSGNGAFGSGSLTYLKNNSVTIDPLPHDQSYFEAHLEFAKNYFETVSGNKLSIEYKVLPGVHQLDQKMEYYSPTGLEFTNEQLAVLARDVWEKVEDNGGFDATGLDPENTAFIIFHAGVGRDIELTGTTLDKTPQDIPSLYLGKAALSQLLNDPGFEGFPINNGAFRIANSLILPRTLSRRGEDISGNEFVLQLSINGLLCATIGSHLGLPDLFDPVTGASGIGRFGLMDGAGIFSYNGLFPPEPSAWEKILLGWITPFEINPDSSIPVTLEAVSLRQTGFIAGKYALSSQEYFLVENRHRDPQNDGATLTIRKPDGSEVQQQFTNNDETFVFRQAGFEELFTPGVLVNIDNFDWSLPGGLDRGPDEEKGTPDDRFLNGGILIWHIDEAVINQQLSGRGVNANPDRRGVDLEEADGAQDIGRPGQNLTIDRSIGSAFDFWWANNNSSVITALGDTLSLYENRFAPDTHPNNNSNSRASSFFEFYEFSENQAVATFHVRRFSGASVSTVRLQQRSLPTNQTSTSSGDSYLFGYPLALSVYTAPADTFLIIPSRQSTYALRINPAIDALFDFQTNNSQQPFVGQTLVLGEKPEEEPVDLNAWVWNGNSWQNSWNATGTANRGFLSSLDGNTLLLDLTDDRFNLSDGSPLSDLPAAELRSVTIDGKFSRLTQNQLFIEGTQVTTPVNPGSTRLYTGALQTSRDRSLFYLFEDHTFYLIDPGAADPRKLLFESGSLDWPAFADFNRDGRLDFLYVDKEQNTLNAVNVNGGMLSSFPIPSPEGSRFMGTPLVADLDGDQSLDLVISAQDSLSMNLYAYNSNGDIKPGFPLYAGSVSDPENQPVHPVIFNQTLYAVSHTGDLKAWKFPNLKDLRWGSRYGNEPYSKVTGRISGSQSPPEIASVLVKPETYNWPNPARDETYIRYQTKGPGKVEVKIITMSGRVIFDQDFDAAGGAPEEHRISTAQWGSGIYLAKITAKINGLESSKLIKIAVVH